MHVFASTDIFDINVILTNISLLPGSEVMTSIWSDGTRGPLAFCIPESRMSQESMVAFNDRHVGRALVVSSGSSTHFTTADVVLHIFEQLYSPALSLQGDRPAKSKLVSFPNMLR